MHSSSHVWQQSCIAAGIREGAEVDWSCIGATICSSSHMYKYTARAEHTAARGDPAGASEGTRTRRGARGRFTHRRRRRRRCQGRGEPGPQGRPRCRSAGPASACVHVRGTPRPRRRGCSAGSPRARCPCFGEARPLPAQAQRQTPVNRRMLWRARGGGQAMAREGAADPQENGGPAAPRIVSTPRETCPRSCPHAWHVAGHCVRARIRRPRTLRDFVGTMS